VERKKMRYINVGERERRGTRVKDLERKKSVERERKKKRRGRGKHMNEFKNYDSNYEFLRIQKWQKKLVNSPAHNQIIVSEEVIQHNHSIGHSLLFMTIQINMYSLEL
jgi:hypothetical protein